jgi:hypothetical protein
MPTYDDEGEIEVKLELTGKEDFFYGLEGIRLAIFGVIASIGLSVGFGFDCAWWVRALAGAGAAFGTGLAFWLRRPRDVVMKLMAAVIRGQGRPS